MVSIDKYHARGLSLNHSGAKKLIGSDGIWNGIEYSRQISLSYVCFYCA